MRCYGRVGWPGVTLEYVAQLLIGPLELEAHILMLELLKSGGGELNVGSSQESVESLAVRRYYPKDNLLQWLLN
jgi:hypothetical protein